MNHDEKKIQKLIQSECSTIDIMKEYAEYITQKERERIVGEIEKYFKNETTLEQKLSFASTKTARDIINKLKEGKE